jgi:hypothetical protein
METWPNKSAAADARPPSAVSGAQPLRQLAFQRLTGTCYALGKE